MDPATYGQPTTGGTYATGGTVITTVIVGESGPEIVHLHNGTYVCMPAPPDDPDDGAAGVLARRR